MKIGVIQASSQKEKNVILYDAVCKAAKTSEVINFGCFIEEREEYSYIDIALEIGLLISSGAIDFMVTGCSSGQGMMLACNSMPGVLCGYLENPQDAYLFGRINDGNVVSFPLGLNYGWAGELNLAYTLDALFSEPFGTGYPRKDAKRKQRDTAVLKEINSLSKISMVELADRLDRDLLKKALQRKNVTEYILRCGTNEELLEAIKRIEF
ncbi:MAG: RpiB/LacA/LacB family sugar-phosphate isomerase [Lachnospiraceae bacterium]|uniref:RpiB/LacA/LacB family sugar-phosphate isomerase n=1 Tax=Roseburia hominis TaxID=301301 RepID=UPI001F30388F|nr:RpiB/LacA/LacB family sugar-phosphate isomerase [Roseburia hominis]MDD6170621.1 RpiB/LacA/LacB family sugar-phosphate isomerase [Lachnospiraceae bacterium]MDY4840447.1 RpiB/LacA/LacB family sugar-phosphate isomerase [Lachnospiraceae bacterium]